MIVSPKPVRAVGTTVALVAIGTALALGTQVLLVSLSIPLLRDLRTLLSYVILVAPLAIALRANVALFGFHRQRLWPALSVGLVLVLAMLLGSGKWSSLASGLTAAQIGALAAFGVVAIVEEGIFRGVLQTQLVAWLGRWRGLIATTVAFTIWHIPLRVLMGSSGIDLAVGLVPVFLERTRLRAADADGPQRCSAGPSAHRRELGGAPLSNVTMVS